MAVVRESPVIAPPLASRELAVRHLRFGWWALLVFLSLGAVLEGMHGFKVGWYLDVSNETRRLLFTLGHAHGVLLAVLNVVFGLTVMVVGANESAPWRIASPRPSRSGSTPGPGTSGATRSTRPSPSKKIANP